MVQPECYDALDMLVIPIQEELLLMPSETLIHQICGFVSCLLFLLLSYSYVPSCFFLALFSCAVVIPANYGFFFFSVFYGGFSTRVFLLGPSHHYYTPKCALTTATVYKTPIGDLPIDLEGTGLWNLF